MPKILPVPPINNITYKNKKKELTMSSTMHWYGKIPTGKNDRRAGSYFKTTMCKRITKIWEELIEKIHFTTLSRFPKDFKMVQ